MNLHVMSGHHVPGPWFVSSIDETVIQTADGGIVAFSTSGEYGVACVPTARLIAAAPELLAACKVAMDWLADHGSEVTDPIRAAIAKAEGTT